MKHTIIIIEHHAKLNIHEQLCKAVHELDSAAQASLNRNVADITVVEPGSVDAAIGYLIESFDIQGTSCRFRVQEQIKDILSNHSDCGGH